MTLDEMRRLRPDLPEDMLAAGLDLYQRERALPVGLSYSRESGLRSVMQDQPGEVGGYSAEDGGVEPAAPAAIRTGGAERRSRRLSLDDLAVDTEGLKFVQIAEPPPPESEKPVAGLGDAVRVGWERMKTGMAAPFASPEKLAEYAAADNKLAAQFARPDSVKPIEAAVDALNKDPSLMGAVKLVGTAVANPGGLAHLTAENVANQLPGMVAPIAGMAKGAAIGGPVGAVIGLLGGSIIGNSPEYGGKIVEMANELARARGLDPTDPQQLLSIFSDPAFQDESSRQGLIKWAVISGVDAVSGGAAGRVVSAPARQLVGEVGEDIAKKVIAKEALASGEKQVVGDALGRFAATQTLGSRAKRYGAAVGLESVGETVGEGAGEYAASGELKAGDALLEGLIAGPQSAVTSYGLGKVQTPEAASALRDAQLDYSLSNPPADETVQGEDTRVQIDLPWFRERAQERIDELTAKAAELDDNAQKTGLTGEEQLEMKQLNAALQDPVFAAKYADSLGYKIVEPGAQSQAQAFVPVGTPPIELPADNNELREMVLGMSDEERADAMIGLPKAEQNRFYAALPHGKNGGAAMLLKSAVEQRTTAVMQELNSLDDAHLELRARNDQNPFVSKAAAQILLDRKASGTQVAGTAVEQPKLNKAATGLMQLNKDIDFSGLSAVTPAGKDGSLLSGQVEDYIRGKRAEMATAAKQKRFDQLSAEGKLVNDHFSIVSPEELSDKPTTVDYEMGGKKYRANRITKDTFGRIQKIAGFFNREVVLVRDERPQVSSYSDGFVDSREPNKVFLNVDAVSAGHLTILGHELSHHLEKTLGGKLYKELSAAIDPHLNANAEDYQRRQGYAGESTDAVFKEIRADLMGNRFGKEKFWQDVFTRLEKRQPGIAKRVKDTVISWFRGVANSMQARKEYAGSEKELISQLRGAVTAVDAAYAKAVANWIKAEQSGKAGSPAEPTTETDDAEVQNAKGVRRPGSDIGHTRESGGRYVGAPDWVGDSPQQLAVLRNTLMQLAKEGEPGRFWYESSSRAILKLVNGNKADAERIVQLIAIYSPSNAVPGNTTMALKAFYQWKAGVPIRVGTGSNDAKANALLYKGEEWSGLKTNSFYQNLMEEIDPSKNDADAATMDMWMAMAFNYGAISIDQGPKYKFMEREIQRVAKQLGWRPHQAQAAIWTAMKGRVDTIRADITAEELDRGWHNSETQQWWTDNRADFIKRRTKHKIDRANGKDVAALTIKDAGIDSLAKGREKDHYRLAFEMAMKNDTRGIADAKYDFSDAINQRIAQMSWEAAPGVSTGVLPGYHTAPLAEQLEYLAMIRAALTDADGNDIIGKKVGLLIGRSHEGFSGWDGAASIGVQDGVAVPINTQDGGRVQQVARDAINLVADIRGLALHQEGVAWHYPIYRAPAYAQNGIEFNIGRPLTEKENADLYRAISDELGHTFSPPIPTSDGQGFRVLNFTDEKFALMDEQLSNDVDADLLGDTGKSIKGKLQSSERKKNDAFREAVKTAVSKQPWHGEVGDVTLFSSDGELRTNDWSNGDQDYRGRIEAAQGALGLADEAGRAGSSDLLRWIDDDLRPRIEAVNRQAAQRFGWEYNGELDLGRPDAAGGGRQRAVANGAGPEVQRSAVREYGERTDGSVSAVGIHYSTQPRTALSGAYYGTGISGAERDRVFSAADRRLRNRIHFYIDAGRGVFPESGVGAYRHAVRLNNLYDGINDLRIQRSIDRDLRGGDWANAFESAVIDAGYDGYISSFGRQNAAVLIGDHAVQVDADHRPVQRSAIHYAPRFDGETDKQYAKRVIDKMDAPAELPEEHERYFDLTGSSIITVPIGMLRSSKSDAENAKGGGNSPKRFRAAYDGILTKRGPIEVFDNGDGTYTIKDGNGTYTGMKQYGWKALPVQVVGKHTTPYLAWDISGQNRQHLLAEFAPMYEDFYGGHITIAVGENADTTEAPRVERAEVIGVADDGRVQALVVRVNGKERAPDGRTYHITWSMQPGMKAKMSNDAIAAGWKKLATPIPLELTNAFRFHPDDAKAMRYESHQVIGQQLLSEAAQFINESAEKESDPLTIPMRTQANHKLSKLMAEAHRSQFAYKVRIERIAKSIGGMAVVAPVKGIKRAAEKLVEDYTLGPDMTKESRPRNAAGQIISIDKDKWFVDKLRDLLRSTIVVESMDDVQDAIDAVIAEFGQPSKLNNRFESPTEAGYSDVIMTVPISDTLHAEIQINIPEMLAAKDIGHGLYEISRKNGKGSGRATEIMNRVYGAARDASHRSRDRIRRSRMGPAEVSSSTLRLNSGNEQGMPSWRARASSNPESAPLGDTQRQLNGRPAVPTTGMDGDTITGIQSTIKNRMSSGNLNGSIDSSLFDNEIVPVDSTAVPYIQQSTIRDDMTAQAAWLNAEAASRGYADIDALLANDARAFFALAEQWRTEHPEEFDEEPVTQHSVLRWMADEQRTWKDSGLIPAEKMAKYVSAINAVIDAVKSGDKLIGETVPLTPVPAVLRMANAPSQWITASMNIAHKMFGDPNNTQHDDNRVGKHREDFVDLTAADVMGMFADPLVVIQSPRGPSQFEIITGKMGAKGPIMFAITIDAQPVAGKRDRMTVIRSGYSLTPSQISSKIMGGTVLYAKSADEVNAMYGDAVSLHDAYQRGEEEKWFREGPGIAPGKGRPQLPPGPKNRLSGQSVKTEADKIKWIEQRQTAAPTAVQRSALRQTETPEFKRWFGDSKVVDADGNPLVVYHGTMRSFDNFAIGDIGYHAGTKAQAAHFHGNRTGLTPGGNVMPVFMSIKNPVRATDRGTGWATLPIEMRANNEISEQQYLDWLSDYNEAMRDSGPVIANRVTTNFLESLGYDGVVYLNTVEGKRPVVGTPDDIREEKSDRYPGGVRLVSDRLGVVAEEYSRSLAYESLDNKIRIGALAEYDDSWIAFRPEQIKSAIGNRGTFDPANPDITKSALRARIADGVMDMNIPTTIGRAVRDRVSDAVRASAPFNPLHRSIATQLHKARINPEFGKVFDLGQKMLDYTAMFAMRAQEQAPKILPDLANLTFRNLTPAGWKQMSGLSDADNTAVGQLLAEGTLFNGPNPHTGKVFSDAELTAKGVTGPQIDAYRQARAAIDQSLDDSAKALLISFARQAGVNAEDLDAFVELDLSLRNVHQAVVSELRTLGKTKAIKDADKVLWEAESLKRHGYSPLMRFGEHTVRVTDAAGETVWFSMHDSEADALRTRAKVQQLGTAVVGRLNPVQYQMYQAISPGLIESFANHIPLSNAAEKEAMQDYLRLASAQRSTMQRMMKREGIAGYSNDATRVLAHFITSAGRQNAKMIVDTRMNRAVEDIADGATQAEAQKLVQYLRDPQEGAAKLRSFLFFNFLGGSVAAGLVNLTQPVMMTYPYLSQYGVGRAGAAMSAGLKATTQWFKSRRVTDPDLHAAMQQAHDQGIIEPQEIFQMMAAAETGTSSILGHKLMRLWGINFAFTEAINRTLTFASAYQIGKDMALGAGLSGTAASADAYRFAVRAVEDTQGLYNKGNRPNWARESGALGAAGTLAFTFKQYSIAYVEMLKRLYDAGPEGKKAAAIALGILVLASGLSGLPGADDLDDLIETVAAWAGKPVNMRKEKRAAVLAAVKAMGMGEGAADFLLFGSSEFLPVDLQARLGLHNLIPGTSLMNPMRKASASEIMEPLGPIGGVIANAMKSAKSAASGDARGAVLPMLPKAVADVVKGGEMMATGEARDQQGRLIAKASPADAVAKMIGFNPSDFAERSRLMRELRTDQEAVQYMQDLYNGMMARSMVERKAELRDEAVQLLREWNREYPELRIKSDMATIMRRAKAMQATQTERFIKATPKAQRQMAQQAIGDL